MSENRDEPDWYLRQWLRQVGMSQADLARALAWDPPRMSKVLAGKVPYRKELVNPIAAALKIEPFELLMPPEEALAMRSLREAAKLIASNYSR